MKRVLSLLIVLLSVSLLSAAQPILIGKVTVDSVPSWWNARTQLNALRLPPPPAGALVEYYDLNGDGKPDMLRTVTPDGTPVQWIDDNDNMSIGDLTGDLVDDCLMIDRNRDGEYASHGDFVIDWVDTDSDGKADIQIVAEYKDPSDERSWAGHYMVFFDDDRDSIFNYIDWNTYSLRCWLHDGLADFYADYHGNSTFLKVHASPEALNDVRLNWENPFLFIDSDKDGLTEMTVRLCDKGGSFEGGRNPDGVIYWGAISVDLDNDNNPENPLDLDMTIGFVSDTGTSYMGYEHAYKKMRGLPEADCLFMDSSIRSNATLIFPKGNECFDFIFKEAQWDSVSFVFDEDGDCKRWERVEFYQPGDLYALGQDNGGLDNHRQSDAIGDRGEWDEDNSGGGNLYISPLDGKLHLFGAEKGAWRIDQRTQSYQGMGGIYDVYGPERQQKLFTGFAVAQYEDTDGNGFFDSIQYDWDGDGTFDEEINASVLGVSDCAKVYDISRFTYKDYHHLYKKMAQDMWKNAQIMVREAESKGIDTSWYALYKNPKSLRQKYDYGFWLQVYLSHDMKSL